MLVDIGSGLALHEPSLSAFCEPGLERILVLRRTDQIGICKQIEVHGYVNNELTALRLHSSHEPKAEDSCCTSPA